MTIFQNVFNAEEIAAGIAEWAKIESPSYDSIAVNKMMNIAALKMNSLGANIDRIPGKDGFGDVVRAKFEWNKDPGILILGHLDTVHLVGTIKNTLCVKRDGDRLYGPGVLDMKGGMYLAIHAFEKIIELQGRLNQAITFLFIPDEEVGSPSTRDLIEAEAKKNRYVLVPEPAKPNKFVTGRHAFLRYKLHTFGQPAHAGVAKGVGKSAISVMAKLIAEVEGFSDQDQERTFRVGVVNGGDFVNVIPTSCHAEVLCVAPTAEDFNEIQKLMNKLKSPDPDVTLKIEQGPIRPLFVMNKESKKLYKIAQRVGRGIGLDLGFGQFGGGSDGNFCGALGIPTLDGLGVCGDGVHTKQEHLLVSSLEPRARLFAGLLEELAR
ncbi:MAG: carboxypeptidase [Gammaproteobacteria bacterium]|nr:carboxypeptidase [Gammaproteobacteria bacterium]|tara:strand:+ start:1526 stop:2659 length:1134 start_codon:yes stop_codon:yes gene_type:complete